MLTLSWAPSTSGSVSTGSAPAAASRRLSTAGAQPATRVPPTALPLPALPPDHATSPVDGSTDVTSAPVRIVAPAETAAAASESVSAPMPPTGTSQSPVPPPMRW